MKSILCNVSVLLISMVGILGTGEVVTRAISSKLNLYDIEMMKYATTLKVEDPLGEISHVHRPNSKYVLMGTEVILNSLGHRSPEISIVDNETRILVIGASHTFGWGVPQTKTFSSLVESKLNEKDGSQRRKRVRVINSGVGNYNTKAQRVLLQRQFPILNPSIVVLNYSLGDATLKHKATSNNLFRYSQLAAYLYPRLITLTYSFNGKVKLENLYLDAYLGNGEQWKESLAQVVMIKDYLEKLKVPFVVLINPETRDTKKGSSYERIYKKIEADFTEHDITFVNSYPKFQDRFAEKNKDLWVAPNDPHINEAGHKLLSETLAPFLLSLIDSGSL